MRILMVSAYQAGVKLVVQGYFFFPTLHGRCWTKHLNIWIIIFWCRIHTVETVHSCSCFFLNKQWRAAFERVTCLNCLQKAWKCVTQMSRMLQKCTCSWKPNESMSPSRFLAKDKVWQWHKKKSWWEGKKNRPLTTKQKCMQEKNKKTNT